MLFVEQPAGVGFSYSENASDYTVGDARAAADVVSFFYGFFAAFPRYANTPLRISGESYGERGLPSLARLPMCSLYRQRERWARRLAFAASVLSLPPPRVSSFVAKKNLRLQVGTTCPISLQPLLLPISPRRGPQST